MTTSDMSARVAKAANQLRMLQAELTQAGPERRAVEYADVIESHLAAQPTLDERQRFLAALDERFPVLAVHADLSAAPRAESAEAESARQRVARLEAELADPFKLVGRLAEHWSGIPEAKKREMLEILARRGSVPALNPASAASPGGTAAATVAPMRPASVPSPVPSPAPSPSNVDEVAVRDLAKWVWGAADTEARRPVPPARLALMVRTLLEHLEALDGQARLALSSINVTAESLKIAPLEELKKAVRDFLQAEGELDWDKLRALNRETLSRGYLKAKRKQFQTQLAIIAQVGDPLDDEMNRRFKPEGVLAEANQIKASKGFLDRFSIEQGVAAALERRLGVGKGKDQEECVKETMQRLAAKAMRDQLVGGE
jgi:hypothetical protein